ncbi:MAG: prenyltransferase/squalene oxidase repeat-containing protein [Planctomycetota bacterium]|jgi:hypothetical protein
MRRLPFFLLLCLCLWLQPSPPAAAQDDDPEIEVGEDDESDEKDEQDEEERRKTRKKNVGLADRGGEGERDDVDAPKVKLTLQQRINNAIQQGVKWLKQRQDKNGSWGPVRANSIYGQPNVRGDFVRDETGPTSFAIYTLAKCDVKKNDKSIKKGIAWLKQRTLKNVHDIVGGKPQRDQKTHGYLSGPRSLTTYESASIVLMIEAVHERSAKLTGKHKKRRLRTKSPMKLPTGSKIPKEDWRWMHARIVHLTAGRRSKRMRIPGTQNKGGGWRYGQASGDQDLSATQIVLLALRAASQAGYPVERVSRNTWAWAANFVKSVQLGNGGFSYQKGKSWTAGMDACGIGSLVICREQMQLAGQEPPSWVDDSIQRGMAHLDTIWQPTGNRGGNHHYYHLYAVERVGDLTGRNEFNGLNWYVRGAEFLLEQQNPDGKWVDGTAFRPHDVLGTCFALLFLKRATPPVVTLSRDREEK